MSEQDFVDAVAQVSRLTEENDRQEERIMTDDYKTIEELIEPWRTQAAMAEAECDRLREVLRESLRVVWLYHEWLEKHEQFNTAPDGRRTGYIGIDHKVGENVEGCSGCAALAEGGEK